MRSRPLVPLFDGHVLIFRAYHSMPDLRAPDGTPTGAAYGFVSALLRAIEADAATHVGVAFDHAMESFRNRELPGYKSSRGAPPDDLEPQFDLCRELTRALGLPILEREDYEADDCLATAAEQLVAGGAEVVVVTTDKDLAQIVREDARTVLRDPGKGAITDADGVRARFGVDPERIPDWLALVGDDVDDLPGVPGFGAKRAAAAIAAFGPLDAMPADPARWRAAGLGSAERLAAALDAHREQALHMRRLATLERAVPGVEASLDALVWHGTDRARLDALFDRLGWGETLRRRVRRWR